MCGDTTTVFNKWFESTVQTLEQLVTVNYQQKKNTKMFQNKYFLNRKRFLGRHNEMETVVTEPRKIEAKYFIKRIGQLYEGLCETMDTVNYTYVFQVQFEIPIYFSLVITCYFIVGR